MEKYLEYQAKIDEVRNEGLAIFSKAEEEKRDLTEEEDTKLEELRDRKVKLERQRDQYVQLKGLGSEIEAASKEPTKPDPQESQETNFRSFGEQLMAVVEAGKAGGKIDPRLNQRATGFSEGIPSEGGFLVQTDFVPGLLKETYETGEVASRCSKRAISTPSNSMKINAWDETSRADGSRHGGFRAYWAAEAEEKTSSKGKVRQINLELNKLIGRTEATDELLQDVTFLEAEISEAFVNEFGFKIDDAVINGTGAGQPLGIMNAGCLVTVSKETGQAATTILAENVIKMWARMWGKSRKNAVWFINQDIEPQLYTMSLAVGTGGIPVYMPANGLSNSPYGKLMGRPVIPIEQCQTLGTTGDIILADLSKYILADKGGMQAASSIHVRFIYDETTFRFVYRIDGQPRWSSALTPYKGSNTLSPFVVLETRS
jgi:HK97 family phage major capsid protein